MAGSKAAAVGSAEDLVDELDEGRSSPRELAVLHGIEDRLSVDDLAAKLFVSRNTIKSQKRALYAKLGVHSRNEAVTGAAELGLLGPVKPEA